MSGISLPLDPSIAEASDCGCCEGVDVQTPNEIWNRAGLSVVQYRIGTHANFKASMLARLSSADYPALRQLTTRDDSDPSIALIDAAAVMADVITFYQERIANESYLRTATEWRSLAALGRLTGYEPSPGVAATAYLAFTLETGAGSPDQTTIPGVTRIQSVPAAGQLPQTFETLTPFTARPEWNAMPVVRTLAQAPLTSATQSVLVQGIASQVRVGDRLLLTNGAGGAFPVIVFAVTFDTTALTTRIDFAAGAAAPSGVAVTVPNPASASTITPVGLTTGALDQAIFAQAWNAADLSAFIQSMKWQLGAVMAGVMSAATSVPSGAVIRFRQRASVFGHNAPAWNTLPAATRVSGGAVDQTLVSGTVIAGAPGSATIVDATITNATIENASVVNVPLVLPVAQLVAGLPLPGGQITSGILITPSPSLPYGTNWDNPNTSTLNYSWNNNTLSPPSGDEAYGHNTVVQLDHSYAGIGPRSWIVMEDKSQGNTVVAQAQTVADASVVAFAMSAKATLIDVGTTASLAGLTRRGTTVFCDNEVLALAPVPVTQPVAGRVLTLDRIYLGLQAGQSVAVSGIRTDLAGVAGTELAELAAVVVWGNLTVLTLTAPLAYSYDPQTVAINANVVLATHGMSVAQTLGNGTLVPETLGSGDASTPFQEFILRQPPLTYVADTSGGGAQSTLQIRVNGELWSEVQSLYGAAPTDRVFVSWSGDDGRTHVLFGDGVTGARLPSGAGNVTATYRTGIGSPGLVGANAVSLLMTRPLGVRSASNPVATTDAADPDAPDMIRQTAPLHVMTLDRIVSLSDYGNYALAYPGIGKALTSWRWIARGRGVMLTIAGPGGTVVDPAGPLARSLLAAIVANSDPNVPVSLADYQPVFFQVGASIKTDPALLRDVVLASVQTALQAAFAFGQRDFGQSVVASEVVTIIQGVTGVIACELTQLSRPPQQSGVVDALFAATPQPGATTSALAEILLIDPRPIVFGVLP